MIVPRAPITIGITVTFLFRLSFFSFSFKFTLWSDGTVKSTIRQVLLFLMILTRFGRLAEIRWSVCISKSRRCLCVSYSKTDSGLCILHFIIITIIIVNIISWWVLQTSVCWWFLTEFERQTFFSSLQVSSKQFGRALKFFSWNGLHMSLIS